jgi:hypothetical protein
MPSLAEFQYDRKAALDYAHKWARGRNPKYYDFEALGGDCTNYVSQCLFAGTGAMSHKKDTGWYYYDVNNRAPSWTSVLFLYNFLTTNKGAGPFGREVGQEEILPGDLVQLRMNKPDFQHTPIIVSTGRPLGLDTILVAAHSIDSDYRPLSTYDIQGIRYIRIDGYRKA